MYKCCIVLYICIQYNVLNMSRKLTLEKEYASAPLSLERFRAAPRLNPAWLQSPWLSRDRRNWNAIRYRSTNDCVRAWIGFPEMHICASLLILPTKSSPLAMVLRGVLVFVLRHQVFQKVVFPDHGPTFQAFVHGFFRQPLVIHEHLRSMLLEGFVVVDGVARALQHLVHVGHGLAEAMPEAQSSRCSCANTTQAFSRALASAALTDRKLG